MEPTFREAVEQFSYASLSSFNDYWSALGHDRLNELLHRLIAVRVILSQVPRQQPGHLSAVLRALKEELERHRDVCAPVLERCDRWFQEEAPAVPGYHPALLGAPSLVASIKGMDRFQLEVILTAGIARRGLPAWGHSEDMEILGAIPAVFIQTVQPIINSYYRQLCHAMDADEQDQLRCDARGEELRKRETNHDLWLWVALGATALLLPFSFWLGRQRISNSNNNQSSANIANSPITHPIDERSVNTTASLFGKWTWPKALGG
jgi:hypothetical protein